MWGPRYFSSATPIPECSAVVTVERCLCLQFELCNGGTLEDLLDERIKKNLAMKIDQPRIAQEEDENYKIFKNVLEGLYYLQIQGVVHKDLKLNNIFISKKSNGEYLRAKTGDFGLSDM